MRNDRLRSVLYACVVVVACTAGCREEAPAARVAVQPGAREDASAQGGERIPLAQLEEMFRQMRAQSGVNVDGPLLWGYFFMDRDMAKLQRLAAHVGPQGYRVVGIHEADDGTHVLHVEKVETHTPQSLHERNAGFYELATRFGVETYDGMDVGPAQPSR